jgi:glycosyltransferase involved in cell wall biosynthesis
MAEMMDSKIVRFRGQVSNIEEIWKENHLLVLPSRYEGLPLALVEAMWCGRPAVVTDVGGNAELCTDGETGFVASAATVSSVGEALERAWQQRSSWQDLGKAARAKVEALVPKNSIEVFCEQLKDCAAVNRTGGSR